MTSFASCLKQRRGTLRAASRLSFLVFILCAVRQSFQLVEEVASSLDNQPLKAKSNVVSLSQADYDSILTECHLALVEFYAPWCGICKRLAPEWEKAADILKADPTHTNDRVLFKVDCTIEKDLCLREGVNAYPTIKLVKQGKDSGILYRGEKTAEAIVGFVSKLVRPPVKSLTTVDELVAFKASGGDAVIVGYFPEKKGRYKEEEATFDQVAAELHEKGESVALAKIVSSDLIKQLAEAGEFLPMRDEDAEEESKGKGLGKGGKKEKENEKKGKEDEKYHKRSKQASLVLYRQVNGQTFYFGADELKQFYPAEDDHTNRQRKSDDDEGDEDEKEERREKEKKSDNKDKKKRKERQWDKDAIKAWITQNRLPLLTKFDKIVFGSDQPAVFVFVDLPTEQNAVSNEFMDIMQKIHSVAKTLRHKDRTIRFSWIDKDDWSGTRLGLSGQSYPAIAISDLTKLNHHYAFGDVTQENVGTLEGWVETFLRGELPETMVSQKLSEAHQLGGEILSVVADTFEDEIIKPDKDVVVLFHSPSCGTSRKYYPHFQELAQRFKGTGHLVFRAGDAWANDFPHHLGLAGMPDMRFFPRGDKATYYEYSGVPDVEAFASWLEKLLPPVGEEPALPVATHKDEL